MNHLKSSLTCAQKETLSFVLRSIMSSNKILQRYNLTRRAYICKLLLRAIALDQPIIYVYHSLGKKTRIQMLRILAYAIDYVPEFNFRRGYASAIYGEETVNCFFYILNEHSNSYLR